MWQRESWRIGRVSLRSGQALWVGLAAWLMLGSGPSTSAFLTISQADPANVVATAKQFTISDVTATAQPAGSVLVSWSAASWAAGGYSVRRGATPVGPFAEVVVVDAATTSYSDSSAVDGSSYAYEVF